ncbi:IS3 family transposase [Sphingobacterium sp. ML3W]
MSLLVNYFFGILKLELFYTKKYTSIDELKEDIEDYNNKRIKLK